MPKYAPAPNRILDVQDPRWLSWFINRKTFVEQNNTALTTGGFSNFTSVENTTATTLTATTTLASLVLSTAGARALIMISTEYAAAVTATFHLMRGSSLLLNQVSRHSLAQEATDSSASYWVISYKPRMWRANFTFYGEDLTEGTFTYALVGRPASKATDLLWAPICTGCKLTVVEFA